MDFEMRQTGEWEGRVVFDAKTGEKWEDDSEYAYKICEKWKCIDRNGGKTENT